MHRIRCRRLSTAIRHGGDSLNSTRRDDGDDDVPFAGFLQVPRNDEESIVSRNLRHVALIASARNFSRSRSKPLGIRVARDRCTARHTTDAHARPAAPRAIQRRACARPLTSPFDLDGTLPSQTLHPS